jgi:hypothetical protein
MALDFLDTLVYVSVDHGSRIEDQVEHIHMSRVSRRVNGLGLVLPFPGI